MNSCFYFCGFSSICNEQIVHYAGRVYVTVANSWSIYRAVTISRYLVINMLIYQQKIPCRIHIADNHEIHA